MVDRHAVQQMMSAGMTNGEVARHFGISPRTVRRIRREGAVTSADDGTARRERRVGRPRIGPEARDRMRALMEEDLHAPRLEVLRQLREEGVQMGESTFYRIYSEVRGSIPRQMMVRFEGVAGEFAQFDFGQVDVRLPEGRTKRIHFAAYRLKYSRWVDVVIVPNERVEALARALLISLERSGGVAASGGLRPTPDGGGGRGRARACGVELHAGPGGHRLRVLHRVVRASEP